MNTYSREDTCVTDGCDHKIEYTRLGLCRRCYNKRQREALRADRETPAQPQEPPSNIVQIHRGRQEVAWNEQTYNPRYHAGHARRMFLLGDGEEKIADVFGISVSMLRSWRDKYPEMAEAYRVRQFIEGYLLEAAYNKALGPMDKHGRFVGGDSRLMVFLLENILGMNKEARAKQTDARQSIAELVTEEGVQRLMEKMGMGGGRVTIDAPPPQPEDT